MNAARRGRGGGSGTIRISGGGLRGQTITVPPGLTVRPMRTRVREALFNVIGDAIVGARLLDVFAGSGAIAIEALSRGAHRAVLVENDRAVIDNLRANLERLGLVRRARIDAIDIYRTLPALIAQGSPFTHAFIDPPFDDYRSNRQPWNIPARLLEAGLLEAQALVGLEYPSDLAAAEPDPPLVEVRRRTYGDTAIALWSVDTRPGS